MNKFEEQKENRATRGLKLVMANTDMLFKSGREENKKMKAALGVFAGILIGIFLYLLLVFSFNYSPLIAGILVVVMTILMCVALALWSSCRCIMALVFPNLFTNKGRGVMMSIVLSLVLTGPIQNITNNARETGSSMACIAEVVANQTKAMRQQVAEPMRQMADYAARNQRKLEVIQKSITQHTDTFMDEYNEIDKEIKGVTNQLNVIYQGCVSTIENAVRSCVDKCDIFASACKGPCETLNDLKKACAGTNFGGSFEASRNKIRNEFKKVENYFRADVVIQGNYDTSTNTSKHVDSIKANIDSDINVTVDTLKKVTTVTKTIMSVTLLLMILEAFWYFRSYMAKDNYDNKYITKGFIELDEKKAKMGETPILPLKKRELSKYIQPRSVWLTTVELAYCTKGVVQVFILTLLCVIMIFGDYSIYYILNLVSRYSSLVVRLKANAEFKITVKGEGPIASFYRVLLGDFDLAQHYLKDIDVGGCLPTPTAPSTQYSITYFIVLFVILVCIVVLRGYGMRLRRKIAAYHYPEQEKQREEYLYKMIKHERQAYQRFIRQEVKSAHKESKMKEKFRLSTWVKTSFPCCKPCISQNTKLNCSSCEETDQQLLSNCNGVIDGSVCTAVYCEECRKVLNGVCALCYEGDIQFRG